VENYDTLKKALVTAYVVFLQVYRKCFRDPLRRTYSEFAFRLTTQFKRWAESEHTCNDVAKLRELILVEQFKTNLEPSVRGWLIDQKPQTLSELSRMADQHVAVHLPDHTGKEFQNPELNQFVHKPGQGNLVILVFIHLPSAITVRNPVMTLSWLIVTKGWLRCQLVSLRKNPSS